MLIELNIGEIQIDGLIGVNESALKTAINEAIQSLLVQRHFPETQLKENSFNFEEISFQIDLDGSIKNMAKQIAEKIMEQLG